MTCMYKVYQGKTMPMMFYRVETKLLRMTVQLNVYYYGNKEDHSKPSHTHKFGTCGCSLVCLDLNDLAY